MKRILIKFGFGISVVIAANVPVYMIYKEQKEAFKSLSSRIDNLESDLSDIKDGAVTPEDLEEVKSDIDNLEKDVNDIGLRVEEVALDQAMKY